MTLHITHRPDQLAGHARVPGDKSLSHRALLLAALGQGTSQLRGLSSGDDVLATAAALRQLGVVLQQESDALVVRGGGPQALQSPADPIDCGNSGTTMRLLCGVLAGLPGMQATLTGDASLSRRPMLRVVEPLRHMGALITTSPEGRCPLHVVGSQLVGCDHDLPVASAQVKSALLLAGLHAAGTTRVREPAASRDHTERLLPALGAPLRRDGAWLAIQSGPLSPLGLWQAPGDPSSAAFLVVAGLLHPAARVTVQQVCVNPTRVGWLAVLQRMGAQVAVQNEHSEAGEPVAELTAQTSQLRATDIAPHEVPSLVDELPILALCALAAAGTSHWQGIGELRVKESDRLAAIARLVRGLGGSCTEGPDWLEIVGCGSVEAWQPLAAPLVADGDHRMAMTAAIAGLCGPWPTQVADFATTRSSWPGFAQTLQGLSRTAGG